MASVREANALEDVAAEDLVTLSGLTVTIQMLVGRRLLRSVIIVDIELGPSVDLEDA